jgi:hypothetical protein
MEPARYASKRTFFIGMARLGNSGESVGIKFFNGYSEVHTSALCGLEVVSIGNTILRMPSRVFTLINRDGCQLMQTCKMEKMPNGKDQCKLHGTEKLF